MLSLSSSYFDWTLEGPATTLRLDDLISRFLFKGLSHPLHQNKYIRSCVSRILLSFDNVLVRYGPVLLGFKGAQNFFITKNVIVRAGGTQGRLYKVDLYLQSAGSAGLVANIFALAKLTGVSGLQILKAQPILVVAISTTGAIFFYGCGAIIGDNTVGKVFVTAGDVLAVPMKGVEIMWNSCGIHILLLEFKEFLGFL